MPHITLPPALRAGSNRHFQALGLYWRSPESGDLWCESRQLTKMGWSHSEGWWFFDTLQCQRELPQEG